MSEIEARGSFSIGQRMWPGVAKLIEETGEVQQVLGKLIAIGGLTEHWSGDLKVLLEEELGDLLAAVDFVMNHNSSIDSSAIIDRAIMKGRLYREWHKDGLL